jgi:hypothetical protein
LRRRRNVPRLAATQNNLKLGANVAKLHAKELASLAVEKMEPSFKEKSSFDLFLFCIFFNSK